MSLLSVENLSFSYPNSENSRKSFSLSQINFALDKGEMLLLYGFSGSGKSTLLRLLKPEIAPAGKIGGSIMFDDKPLNSLSDRHSAEKIGFVGQSVEAGIVTENVLSEFAFLPQNLGMTHNEALRKISELSSFFGIEKLCNRRICELSSGQKQLVAIAAAMVASPELLLLDEPTSRLDANSTERFFAIINRIRRELGTAIIICEHSAERFFHACTQVLCLENGRQIFCSSPQNAARMLKNTPLFDGLPTAVKLSSVFEKATEPFENLSQAHSFLRKSFKEEPENFVNSLPVFDKKSVAIYAKGILYRYGKYSENVIDSLDYFAAYGTVSAICGENGTGKTTLLRLFAGDLYPCLGKIYVGGKRLKGRFDISLYRENLAMLPQNPSDIMFEDSIYLDLLYSPDGEKRLDDEIFRTCESLGLDKSVLSSHYLDVSGGELQRAALAKLLLLNPKIILMDEPSKSLDSPSKHRLADIIRSLATEGRAVIFTTHDLDFAAECADSIALLFGGAVAAHEPAVKFLRSGDLFTTSAARVSKGVFSDTVSDKRLIEKCLKMDGCYEK